MVERALRGAPAHGLLDCLRVNLVQRFAASEVDLLLIDHGLTHLRPVDRSPAFEGPATAKSALALRVFSAQQPYLSGDEHPMVTAYLPVTVRGDRCGVLVVTLPGGENSPDLLEELSAIAQMLGHAMRVAERHTDVYRRARRERPLTLSAEMLWQLMPDRSCSRAEFDLQAYWEPAYTSGGHLFDWSAAADQLTLVVANGHGPGVDDALVNNLVLNALRNARRAGLDLASQASLADQALYGQHRGTAHVSTLLTRFDFGTGEVEVVDAGSPTLWRLKGGAAERVELESQLPLGMFEDTIYSTQRLRVEPGERLVFVACDAERARSADDEKLLEEAVGRAVTANRSTACADTAQAVLSEIVAQGSGSVSSGLVVCLDWRGKGGDSG